jgi:mannose-6-phosphate isomerase
MKKLINSIQNYDWGSHTALPEFLGRTPDGLPQAELWMGAHPKAPSRLEGVPETLNLHIQSNATATLGPKALARFGPQLPYLLKVLAAKEPLSLQAHPSLAQAQRGFRDEENRAIPLHAPNRNFKDENHKPELIVAHSDFVALCGFRPLQQTLSLLSKCAPNLKPILQEQGLSKFVAQALRGNLLAFESELRRGLEQDSEEFRLEFHWINELAKKYPRDPGLTVALLLNCVELKPSQGLFLGAGQLHAYLSGTGFELMANSDNVLRGGLTSKHVDIELLLSLLTFEAKLPKIIEPDSDGCYPTPVEDFALSRLTISGPKFLTPRGPEILLVTKGLLKADFELRAGESAFVPFSRGPYQLDGAATVLRAEVGLTRA